MPVDDTLLIQVGLVLVIIGVSVVKIVRYARARPSTEAQKTWARAAKSSQDTIEIVGFTVLVLGLMFLGCFVIDMVVAVFPVTLSPAIANGTPQPDDRYYVEYVATPTCVWVNNSSMAVQVCPGGGS